MKIYQFVFDSREELLHCYYKGEALIRKGYPLFLPNTSPEESYVAYPSLLVRIGRTGREVASRFSHRYINGLGVGFDIVHHNRLCDLIDARQPWSEAVAFEYAAAGVLVDESFDEDGLQSSYHLEWGDYTLEVTETMIRKAVERMSYLNIIHVGDILLVRPQILQHPALQVEQNYSVNAPGLGEYTLRVK
jgi:hypothetical protein